ncbi:MAG: hypothetical protein JXJ17_14880 [Anaerolineae bacterium]|nr:hypothetical protein [Anaerolineae bacterium]
MESEKANTPTPPVGVIESLTRGFETVAGSLVLILLPLLLDLFLWVGPRLDFRPAFASYYYDLWEPMVASMDTEMQSGLKQFGDQILELSETMPDQYLPIFGMPSLMAWREAEPLPFGYIPPVWEVRTSVDVLGANVLSLLAGFVLFGCYITVIAERVKSGKTKFGRVLARLPINLIWLGLFFVTAFIILFLIYIPFLLVSASFLLVSELLSAVINFLGLILIFWIAAYVVFTIHGIFLNERGLFRSLWDSIRVVQWNMPQTITLFLLVAILSTALSRIWLLAPVGSWTALLAIGGNAFVQTGLIAATFFYYKDRYRYWQESRAEMLARLEQHRIQ